MDKLKTLNKKQTKLARKVLRVGRRKTKKMSTAARRDLLLSAIETGLVESKFHNLRGGTGDSAGWRQESAALYKNPRNVRASSRRYFHEAKGLYHGQSPGRLAAQVQRPAPEYRKRYQHQRKHAKKILRDYLS